MLGKLYYLIKSSEHEMVKGFSMTSCCMNCNGNWKNALTKEITLSLKKVYFECKSKREKEFQYFNFDDSWKNEEMSLRNIINRIVLNKYTVNAKIKWIELNKDNFIYYYF